MTQWEFTECGIRDDEARVSLMEKGWLPFTVGNGLVYFKRAKPQ